MAFACWLLALGPCFEAPGALGCTVAEELSVEPGPCGTCIYALRLALWETESAERSPIKGPCQALYGTVSVWAHHTEWDVHGAKPNTG